MNFLRPVLGVGRRASITCVRPCSTTANSKPPLVALCILDGWGYRETPDNNAVVLAKTPNFDELFGTRSQIGQTAFLDACEQEVGLPTGQIGNSEVGHMNIGAGRIVYQDICLIDKTIEDNEMLDQEALQRHIDALKSSGGTCHLMGLISDGGVHAMQSHAAAIANIVSEAGIPVVVHAFTDGRDTNPTDAEQSFPRFLESLNENVTVGSVTGRYFAMDRDNRWERVNQTFDAIVNGKGVAPASASAMDALNQAYANGETDEFVRATIVGDYAGMKDNDGLLMTNFRADRAREILSAICDPNPSQDMKDAINIADRKKLSHTCGMVVYSDEHKKYMDAIFPPKEIQKPLGEAVADAGLKQVRAAETEKYPHVTFFLNGGREVPFEGETRILVPSPKVATYDLQPEMSAPELSEQVCAAIDSGEQNMVVVNFANPDMVGHTGSLPAAIKACETVDTCLGNLLEAVKRQSGVVLVTADHGNCEKMWNESDDCPHTAHTLNKVPIILSDFSVPFPEGQHRKLQSGRLADIAPTILEILEVPQPEQMTGSSLLITDDDLAPHLPDGPRFTRPVLHRDGVKHDRGSCNYTYKPESFEAIPATVATS